MLFLFCSHQAISFLFLLIWKANIAEVDENVKSWESAAQLMRLLWHLLKMTFLTEVKNITPTSLGFWKFAESASYLLEQIKTF